MSIPKERPLVKITIEGRDYEMIPTFKVLSNIESELDTHIFEMVTSISSLKLDTCKCILKEALKKDSIDNEIIEEYIMSNYIEAMQKAIDFLSCSFCRKENETEISEEDIESEKEEIDLIQQDKNSKKK